MVCAINCLALGVQEIVYDLKAGLLGSSAWHSMSAGLCEAFLDLIDHGL